MNTPDKKKAILKLPSPVNLNSIPAPKAETPICLESLISLPSLLFLIFYHFTQNFIICQFLLLQKIILS
jgi:hypothetical protein